MFCTQCDTQRARNQKICINCGSFLEAATPAVRGTYTGHRKEINSLLLSGGLVAVMAIVLIPLFSYLRTQPQAASNAKIDKAPPATTQSDFVVQWTIYSHPQACRWRKYRFFLPRPVNRERQKFGR